MTLNWTEFAVVGELRQTRMDVFKILVMIFEILLGK